MKTKEEVKKVALLARLELTPDEEIQFTEQLGSILQYFEKLSELDVSDVPPTTRAIELSNIMREDHLQPYSDPQQLLQIAPEPEESFFKVPKIL